LSILMQCAAEGKYCAGVLGQLRGRAAAQLRGNIGGDYCIILTFPAVIFTRK